jgi:type I restriction-modification system DNA methylase subunit
MPDLRESIQAALFSVENSPLRDSAIGLLSTLGYRSDRTINFGNSNPKAFLNFILSQSTEAPFSESKALFESWKSADLLFQLTDEELASSQSLFQDNDVKPGLLRSYLFFAIELTGEGYARGKLTGIARQINRVFPMPVMVLIKHVADKKPVLSIAVINRRQNKREAVKDVLGKVTIIRDISLYAPHRGHLDILASFARANLVHPQRLPINNFDTLHAAWEEIFNVELLNKRFYRELANWYFWALPQVDFPADTEPDDAKRRATSLIRLLTRLIFCWFLKEKGLVPEKLFNETDLGKILNDLSPDACTYYQAILQNLFFATLNQRMGKDKNGQPFRAYARDEGFQKNRATYGVDTLYRYEEHFRDSDEALEMFADVPFLNGGLFECLDRAQEGTNRKLYLDGFSRNKKKRPNIPNRLFFAGEQSGIDLSDAYGESNRRNEKVRGLLRILHSYKFTVVENTPIDQEIALDPELLGKVFENLLASYNEETKTTARKQTGSFYTPRPIVEYMVDESLKAHLAGILIKAGMSKEDTEAGLEILFTYTEREHPFREREVAALLEAIHTSKILDPACGSGAFPMGMLQKLVYIIHKLDPDNARWKQIQIDAAGTIPDSSARDAAISAIERDFADNEDDYGRKLYLIENCLYGVDIQPIAIQISKLRFFISLICDQRTNRNKKENLGIRPLPNLETKFVAADTLNGLPEMDQLALIAPRVHKIESEIEALYHSHFAIQRRDQKLAVQKKIKELREELGKLLAESLGSSKKAQHIADWDAFDPQGTSDFFDPHWMFGRSLEGGFDIVIGNPPFGADITKAVRNSISTAYYHQDYQLDSYLLFMERGLQLLKGGGVQALILPNTWLPSIMLKSIRKYIFSDSTLLVLVDIREKVFSAVVDNIILIHSKSIILNNIFPVQHYDQQGFHDAYLQEQSQWAANNGRPVSIALTPRLKGISSLIESHPTLDQLCEITPGCKPYQVGKGTPPQTRAIVTSKPFTSETKMSSAFRPLLRGRLITRFQILWNNDLWIKFGDWLAEPRHTANYDAPLKIVVRQTGDSLIAALDEAQFIVMNNMFTVVPRSSNTPLLYILCAINSSTLNWYYQNCINPEKGEALAEIKKGHLVRLPIPRVTADIEALFSKLAALVQLAKSSDHPAAMFFDDLIDACVMECYFREHMAQRDLLFLDDLASHLADYDAASGEAKQREFLSNLHRTLNAPSSKIRNRLLRLTADSPDLLGVIKAEGKA